MRVRDYYNSGAVRARMVEFLGGGSLEDCTCEFISRCDGPMLYNFVPKQPKELGYYLDNELDVARSLWDRESLVAHLDIEYVNFDFPAEPYLDPKRTFEMQEPVVASLEGMFSEYGLSPLHFLSGRGHHFVWRMARHSNVIDRLGEFGRVPPHLQALYDAPHGPGKEKVDVRLGKAFSGLGMVMEYLAHRVQAEAAGGSRVPVMLSAVAVGPQERGREIISLDITEYGDPLHTRMIRIPFSIYLKPWEQWGVLNAQIEWQVPAMFLVPFDGMSLREGIEIMRSGERAAERAEGTSVVIVEQSAAMERMVEDYRRSPLAAFHDWFYSQEHEPKELWSQTYDTAPLWRLPSCVRHILEHPNELLLKPAGIRQVVVVLMALGWHPRHIAGLIRSKYERDYGWLAEWLIYDAATRADFYTRLFAGLIEVGRDELVDFNCLSTKEKGWCFTPAGWCDLERFRKALLERSLA